MAIAFDTARKHIVLDSANESWANIWSRWIDWAAQPGNRQWPLAFNLVGGISLGGGLFIPPYFFLTNGWRVRPMEANHDLILTGNGFVEGGGTPVVPTLGVFRVNVQYTVPVQAQGISTSGSTGPTAAEIAAASWNRPLEDGVTAEQMLRIMFAALVGVTDGVGTSNEKYMALDGTTPRIDATFDANNNRTIITLDGG